MAGVRGRSGGYRHGAGRKGNIEIELLRGLIDSALSESDWRAIIGKLAEDARQSGTAGTRACELLWKYRFGMPPQPLSGEPDTGPVRIIEVNSRDDEPVSSGRKRKVENEPASGTADSV